MIKYFSKSKKIFWLVIANFIFLIVNRFIPFTKGLASLGYDSGLYRGRFIKFINTFPEFDIASICPNEPPFLYVLVDFLSLLKQPVDFILYGWYFIFTILLGLVIFIFLYKKYKNISTGLAGLFLYTVSLVQFEAYWNVFYKNILAFILTILIFYFLEKKFYVIIIFLGAVLLATHHMSFALLAGALFFYAIFNKEERKNIFTSLLAMTALGTLCYFNNWQALLRYLPFTQEQTANILNIDTSTKTGSFWKIDLFLFYTIWYLPLALWQILKKFKQKKLDYLFWYFILSLIIIIGQLFFYRRFLIHLDFIIIILAAPALVELFNFIFYKNKKNKLIYKTFFIIWILFLLLRVSIFSFTTQPLISDKEFLAVKDLTNLDSGATIISTNSDIAPWVYGYSERASIWPGKFKNDLWKYKQWQVFWQTNNEFERHKLLNKYSKPVYLFIPKSQRNLYKTVKKDPVFKCYNNYVCEYQSNELK